MIVTTMDGIAGRMTQETLGVVRGTSLWTRRVMKSSFGGIRHLQVTGVAELDAGLEKAKNDAHKTMLDQARVMGADSIIGVRVDVAEMSNGVFCVHTTGTAVKTMALPHSLPAYPQEQAAADPPGFDMTFMALRPSFEGSALRH